MMLIGTIKLKDTKTGIVMNKEPLMMYSCPCEDCMEMLDDTSKYPSWDIPLTN